ncbi:hypothetical protein [Stenoxybacter acetivorans]|uniref:hypothetical protein n=1 Tax=Stenoxybacter acetivorans TaxID=422441 RepID=UPI00055CEC78|nr:hypothetical protein [Stenoxybacter acetivorans]
MAKLYIRIAEAGTLYKLDDCPYYKISLAGHMWIEIYTDNGVLRDSIGFASQDGEAFGPGKTVNDDASRYEKAAYTAIVDISTDQARTLLDYQRNPANYGYDTDYNVIANSCVDFVSYYRIKPSR